MIARVVALALASGSLPFACGHPATLLGPEGAAAPSAIVAAPTASGSSTPRSRFHLAVRTDRGATGGLGPEPCPLPGRMRICRFEKPLVADGHGVEVDEEVARLQQAVAPFEETNAAAARPAILGHWPDDVWVVATAKRVEDEPRSSTLFRWRGGRLEPFAHYAGEPFALYPWQGGLLFDGHPAVRPGASPTNWGYLDAAGTEVPAVAATFPSPPNFPDGRFADVAAVDGDVFLLEASERYADLRVRHFSPNLTRPRVDTLGKDGTNGRLWAHGARDVFAFGGNLHADEQPFLQHFDGERWTALGAPPGIDYIDRYVRTATGVERAFAYRGRELSLWERAPGATWERVTFPALVSETVTGHWLTDDDAWLRIATTDEKTNRLVRLAPVDHVLELGTAITRVPVDATRDPLPAAAPVAEGTSPVDPSPFHDAVIGYVSREDAYVPSALRVCPIPGRTYVCGAGKDPLFSTADGVIAQPFWTPVDSGETVVAYHGSWPNDVWLESWRLASEDYYDYHLQGSRWVLGPVHRRRANTEPTPKFTGPLPPNVDAVVAYQRASTGVERLFARTHDGLAFYERPENAASAKDPTTWQRVPLPTLSPREHVKNSWLANDDAWLLVEPDDVTKNPPRLLRLSPVKKVWSYPRELPSEVR